MSTIPILPYHPERDGLDRWFSPRRADLMQRVWAAGRRGVAVADLLWAMDRDGITLSPSAIACTLGRLERMGIVERDRVGRGSHPPTRWRATCTESAFIDAQLAALYASLDIVSADAPR